MKYVFSFALLTALLMALSCHKDREVLFQKKTDKVTVTVSTSGKSLAKGVNTLGITIVDRAGVPVSNAAINVRYFKTGSGAQHDRSTPAFPEDGFYRLLVDLDASGEWNFEIHVLPEDYKSPAIDFVFEAQVP